MADDVPNQLPAPIPAIRQASCACGALRFSVQGDPVHVHACTCTQCQRVSGGAMTLSAYFPIDKVTVTGKHTRHHHHGSQFPDRFRGFCPTCGTGQFFQSSSLPATLGISVGSFADPHFPFPEFVIYWDDRPQWLGPPKSMKIYPQGDD